MSKLIGLAGPKHCGKSTIAKAIVLRCHMQDEHQDAVRRRFAGKIKAMLRALGLTEAQVDGDEKDLPCELLGGKTPRDAMTALGTEWGRCMMDDELWLRATMQQVDVDLAEDTLVVIDDVRFDNEATAIRERDGVVIKLVRNVPERQFPIIAPRDNKGRALHDCPTSVPWALVEPHRERAMTNHSQTLEELAERGGLAPDELHAVVHNQKWRPIAVDAAVQWLSDKLHPHASEAGVSPHLIDVIVPNQDAPETVARFILDQLKVL